MSNFGTLSGVHRDGGPVPVEIVTPATTARTLKQGNTTYFGLAIATGGTAVDEGAPVWRIQRVIKDTSAIFAGGTKDFKHVWDDVLTLNYP